MQFAKLFDFPTGQLLVTKHWEGLGSTGYSSLVTTTKYQPVGEHATIITATTRVIYPTTQERDTDFDAFDSVKAGQVFDAQQQDLSSGREVSFSIDQRVISDRRMGIGLTKRPQQEVR